MDEKIITEKARDDFNRARFIGIFSKLLSILKPEKRDLLAFHDVVRLVRPTNQKYKGMTAVPINLIVGSEGRYRDFDKAFLPRYDHLRLRWESVDRARLKEVILPPIKLYEIGGVYFVRDGNHRVSVAKSQGIEVIDAEVVTLAAEIGLKPSMTKEDLKNSVIEYEKKKFYKETKLESIIDPGELNFTDIGLYEEILLHINGHKYYLNLSQEKEIKFELAARSWYENIFKPIINSVREENLLSRFPGRTEADLYVWIVKHWDELKRKFGQNIPIEQAAIDYSKRYGKSPWQLIKEFFIELFKTKEI